MTTPARPTLAESLKQLNRTLRQEVVPIIGRLPAYGRLVYTLVKDDTLTGREKTPLFLAIGYQVSPVDLIPGFIPVIGQLDDLFVLFWALQHILDKLPPERAAAYLTTAKLTREQLDTDMAVVRRALGNLLARGAQSVGKAAYGLLKAGIYGSAYLGFRMFYTLRGARKK